MNTLHIIGYLTADPTTRATSTGKTVATFAVGVTRSRKDANGDRVSDFFRVNAWGPTAYFCGKYLKKGSMVAVTGELNMNSYEGKDGKTRYSLDVQADKVENLTERKVETKLTSNNEWQDISSDDLPWKE